MSLKGKVAIVTGGNSGIGKAIALGLAKAGANITIDYVAHPEATDALERDIAALGAVAFGVKADASRVEELQTLVSATVAKFGRVDIMVNNAGVETRTSVLDTTEAQYDKVLAINLKSAFFGTQIAARQMVAQGGGGRIINITSVHEDWPMPGNTAYCLAKGGMRMLTRTAGVELAPHGIRVVGVGRAAAREAGCRYSARAHGRARGDRQCCRLPRRRRCQLCDGDDDLRRWRDHAGKRRAVVPSCRSDTTSSSSAAAPAEERWRTGLRLRAKKILILERRDWLPREACSPFPAPCAVMMNEAAFAYGRCIRCQTCNGFSCLVHAKSDAEVIAVRPALEHS